MEKNITIIPQRQRSENERIPVAVYCRVSTKAERQSDSLENQIEHYTKEVGGDPRYELVEIYYDFGISGFKDSRPGFQRMMEDAEAGRFKQIITKELRSNNLVGFHPNCRLKHGFSKSKCIDYLCTVPYAENLVGILENPSNTTLRQATVNFQQQQAGWQNSTIEDSLNALAVTNTAGNGDLDVEVTGTPSASGTATFAYEIGDADTNPKVTITIA